MATDVGFDSATLTIQPSRLEVTEPTAVRRQVSNGGYIFSSRSKGRVVRLIFGVTAVQDGVLDELRTARGGVVAHTLQWTDPDSNSFDINVGWEADPPYGIGVATYIERFVIVLYERPD